MAQNRPEENHRSSLAFLLVNSAQGPICLSALSNLASKSARAETPIQRRGCGPRGRLRRHDYLSTTRLQASPSSVFSIYPSEMPPATTCSPRPFAALINAENNVWPEFVPNFPYSFMIDRLPLVNYDKRTEVVTPLWRVARLPFWILKEHTCRLNSLQNWRQG